jgi:hypothetical protein
MQSRQKRSGRGQGCEQDSSLPNLDDEDDESDDSQRTDGDNGD